MEVEEVAEQEAAATEDDDSAGTSAGVDQGIDTADKGNHSQNPTALEGDHSHQEPVDNALAILVRNAIYEFGQIPRDVYAGVYKLDMVREEHNGSMRQFQPTELLEIVRIFSWDCELPDIARQMVVVYPSVTRPDGDRWGIDFKSVRIAEKAVEVMRSKKDTSLWGLYNSLRAYPQGFTLAGWVFKAIAHRVSARVIIMPPSIPMTESPS